MKRVTLNYGLFQYTDRNGYERFSIGRCGKNDKPLKSFKSQLELKYFLKDMIFDFKLCPRLAGLQPIASGKCNYIEDFNCEGACCKKENYTTYNIRVQRAIEERVNHESTYVLKKEYGNKKEQAIVLVEKGRYKGYGKVSVDLDLDNIDFVKSKIHSAYDDQDMSILVNAYFRKAKEEDIIFLNN